MSLRKNTLNKINQNITRANKLKTIDQKTNLEDLGEAIRKEVRKQERERIPDITREKMKKAQEKRDRKKVRTVIILDDPIPTEGRDEGSLDKEMQFDEYSNEVFDPNGIKNDSSK